jgi:DNA mismatch endonuclease (patch repair protein)
MSDVLTHEQRHLNMSRIGPKDTKPEMLLRRGLHAMGYRYHLHWRKLPGSPDIVFPRHKAVVFVHGCFWHGHRCHLFKLPETRADFWLKKISGNEERDKKVLEVLCAEGWRVLIVWECAVRGTQRYSLEEVLQKTEEFLEGDCRVLQLLGKRGAAP